MMGFVVHIFVYSVLGRAPLHVNSCSSKSSNALGKEISNDFLVMHNALWDTLTLEVGQSSLFKIS